MSFKLTSTYQPTGDQPEAIRQLVRGVTQGEHAQVLLGVTGSGKTFTVANVIQEVQRPVLVLTHNKTLTAQLYGEFKEFFPDNAVEYFVSYYDYYQPEAYLSVSDTVISSSSPLYPASMVWVILKTIKLGSSVSKREKRLRGMHFSTGW